MASVVKVTSITRVTTNVTLAGPEVSGQALAVGALNPAETSYTSSTTPPVTDHYAETITLPSSGAQSQTIDLTSWTDMEGISKDSSGKEVQGVRIICDSANSGVMTIAGGDSNPYELWGSGNELDCTPGCTFGPMWFGNDQLDRIGLTSGVTAKDIKISGTGGDSMTLEMWIG